MTRIVVGLGELAVSQDVGQPLAAVGLGSCVAVVLTLVAGGLAGLAHVVLPKSDPSVQNKPQAYYANVGVPRLLAEVERRGGSVSTGMRVLLVGGASLGKGGRFDVGKKNVLAVKRQLFRAGLAPVAEDVGGSSARTVSVDIRTGEVFVETNTGRVKL